MKVKSINYSFADLIGVEVTDPHFLDEKEVANLVYKCSTVTAEDMRNMYFKNHSCKIFDARMNHLFDIIQNEVYNGNRDFFLDKNESITSRIYSDFETTIEVFNEVTIWTLRKLGFKVNEEYGRIKISIF